jgi:predicted RNase H-like HicB family nuclease
MLTIEIEREEDGRWIGEVPELPGVLAYGATEAEARAKTTSVALRVLADRIEHGEPVPFVPVISLLGHEWLAGRQSWQSVALVRLGWAIKRQRGSHRTLSRPGWQD